MHIPLILALGRERQVDLCVFEGTLVYRVISGQPELHRETLSCIKNGGGAPLVACYSVAVRTFKAVFSLVSRNLCAFTVLN